VAPPRLDGELRAVAGRLVGELPLGLARHAAFAAAGALVTTHYMDEAEQCDRLVVMADGRVVADGTIERIVGDVTVVEIRAGRWDEAFAALDAGPVPPTLRGRSLRLPAAERERARRVLEERGIPVSLTEVPATLEEAFVRLAQAPAA
jgi:ABC-2 type transport system ATP-binding protein